MPNAVSSSCAAPIRVAIELRHRTVTVEEGSYLQNITYTDVLGTKHFCKEGRLCQFIGTTKTLTKIPDICCADPYLQDYINITDLVLDISSRYDMDFIRIPIKNLIDIEGVDGDFGIETTVDNIFEKHDDITEESDNVYQLISSNTDLRSLRIFEDIAETENFERMAVSCNNDNVLLIAPIQSFEPVYTMLNKYLPKSNLDQSIEIKIQLRYK